MTIFRPCIDLHQGQVKQIVGGSLRSGDDDNGSSLLQTNFIAKRHQLKGGHIIMLGPGNDQAVHSALKAWPNAFQVGGGINEQNCQEWLEAGAEKVIVTSWLFPNAQLDIDRLRLLSKRIGPERLVIDLRLADGPAAAGSWVVATNKWQTMTNCRLSLELFQQLSVYCSEFLVHAADVEGLCRGIDRELVRALAEWSPLPVTYAGGAQSIDDLRLVHELSAGRVDLTIGSALDIFGGAGVSLQQCIEWNKIYA